LAASSAVTFAPQNSGFDLFMGKRTTGEGPFNGVVDEVRISNVARYTSNFTPSTLFTTDSDTVAYYRFNEGEGTTAHDVTGNHNATLQGSPLPTWVEGR
jgi:hypothetical protein